jgi:hypothetical protein
MQARRRPAPDPAMLFHVLRQAGLRRVNAQQATPPPVLLTDVVADETTAVWGKWAMEQAKNKRGLYTPPDGLKPTGGSIRLPPA